MPQIGCGTQIAKKKNLKKFHGKFSKMFKKNLVKFFHEIAERSVAISEFKQFKKGTFGAKIDDF
jgi:hypothetical protein